MLTGLIFRSWYLNFVYSLVLQLILQKRMNISRMYWVLVTRFNGKHVFKDKLIYINWVPLKTQQASFAFFICQKLLFPLSQIWQVLKTIYKYDTYKFSRKNSHHDRNGSGFFEAPLKCSFTTWMSGLAFKETSKTIFASSQQHLMIRN